MAINRVTNTNQIHQQTLMREVANSGTKHASVSAQTGGSSVVGKQAEKNKTDKTPGEQVKLSDAALAQSKESEAADNAEQMAKDGLKDKAAIQNKSNRELKGKDDDDKKIGAGRVQEKENTRVFPLDDDGEEGYEVTEAQGKKMDALDRKTPESILQGMPEGARKAAEATLDTQIKTKGTDKVAQLKDDPKITAVAEQLDLDPVESFKESAKVAPIRDAKNEAPMMVEDTHSENLAKEAAMRQLQNGGADEAFVA